MPASRDELLTLLRTLGIDAVTVEHPPLFTVEQSKALRGEIPGAHTKNLFLKCKKGKLFLVVALESTPIDLKTLHHHLGSGRLSFGSADLLRETLGVEPGSVTPFAVLNDAAQRVSIVLDAALMDFARLNFHPLVNTATTGLATNEFLSFLEHLGRPHRILRFDEEARSGTQTQN